MHSGEAAIWTVPLQAGGDKTSRRNSETTRLGGFRHDRFGQDQLVLALMLTLPATLLGLVGLLVITSGLERQLTKSVRPAPARIVQRRLPTPVSERS